jgi:hypothetical protein
MHTQPYPDGGRGQAQTNSSATANSLLVADCGAVFTKVSLFGLVEGQYRLLARGETPTTISPPNDNLTIGIIQAITIIEFITGRRFISDKRVLTPEQENGDGVDIFIATISAGGPLRLAVLGAVSSPLENLVSQAISGLYADAQFFPAPAFSAASSAASPTQVGVGGRPPASGSGWTSERVALEWERLLGRMRELNPQAAIIVGLADSPAGPNALQEACQLLVNMVRDRNERHSASASAGIPLQDSAAKAISVLYAGAPQYVEAVKRLVKDVADIKRVDPLTGPAQLAAVSTSIGALHDQNVLRSLPGYDQLLSWTGAPPVATATSLSSLVRFLAQHYTMNVTALDVGGSTTTVMQAGEQGEFIPLVNSGIGVGPGASAILQRVGWQRIARWLPFTIKEDEIRLFVANMLLHPYEVPTSSRELQLSQAFAREAIMLTVEEAKKYSNHWSEADLILATGGVLAHAPKYGQVVLMLLDALQPRGVTSLVLDKTMLISQLGAVASVAPITAVQVNENDAVTHRLGTCVIPYGNLQPGQLAVRVGVEYSNGRQQTVDVMAGSIEVIPLQLNEQALLTLFPAPTVDVGLGPGERARAAEEVDGGLVGLIVDARGRPLVLPKDDAERQTRLLQWSQALKA